MAEAQEARASHWEGGVAGKPEPDMFLCSPISILICRAWHWASWRRWMLPSWKRRGGEQCNLFCGLFSSSTFHTLWTFVFYGFSTFHPPRQEMLEQGLDPNPPARQDHEKVPFPKYEEYQVRFPLKHQCELHWVCRSLNSTKLQFHKIRWQII